MLSVRTFAFYPELHLQIITRKTHVLLLYLGAAAPPLEKCKPSDPKVTTILLQARELDHVDGH